MSIHAAINLMASGSEETVLWLAMGLEIFLMPALLHWMSGPRRARAGMLFSVRVEPGFANSDLGRAILQRYRRRIWLWAGAVSVIYFAGSWSSESMAGPLWFLLIWYATMIGCLIAFSLASRETRLKSTPIPAPAVRTTALFTENDSTNWWVECLNWLGMLLPPAVPAVAACVLILHSWQLAPNALWDSSMQIVFAAYMGIFPAGTQFALHFHARSSDWHPDPLASQKYRTALGFLGVLVFSFLSLKLCFLATMPVGLFHSMERYFSFSFRGYAILFALLIGIRWWLKKNVARESSDPMRDDCWKWGLFYSNPDDPAWVVPSRSGTGFSYNYGLRAIQIVGVTMTVVMIIFLAQIYAVLPRSTH